MRILKEYETKINLSPTEMYSGILSNDDYIMNFLRKQFEGHCMESSFITNIKSIKERSLVSIDKNDLGGRGSICVVFCAEAVVYPPGSIIVGAQVAQIERDGRIICKYDNALIHLRGDRKFAPSKGDLIPVQVIRTGYPLGSDNMAIAAQPYWTAPTFSIRLVQPELLTPDEKDLVSRKLTEITDLEKVYADLPVKVKQFFEENFYPFASTDEFYKNDTKSGLGKLKSPFEQVNLIELATQATTSSKVDSVKIGVPICFSRHSAIPKYLPTILQFEPSIVKQLPTGPWTDRTKLDLKLTTATYSDMLIEFLDDYCSWLDLIIKCVEVYQTETIRKHHQKLWTIYQALKV